MIHIPTQKEIDAFLGPYKGKTRQGKPVGRYVLWDIDEHTGKWTPAVKGQNTYLYQGAYISAQCIGLANPLFKVGTMYMEFVNTATLPISVPTVNRYDTVASYYSAPTSSGDFLRVPMTFAPTISISSGYNSYYNSALGEGNVLTFYAQSAGTTGVLGQTFSSTANSTVIGIALVATPVPATYTSDYLFSRGYLPTTPTNQQKPKLANAQIGITWTFSWL